jgi:trimethylamine-N-oxide reductase (cytochrome c), cytochrome c-type subunit TorC
MWGWKLAEQGNEKRKWLGWVTKAAIGAFAAGAVFTALMFVGFDVVAHVTKSNEFCTSCHSMTGNFAEYQGTVHFQNRMGVQAGCSDCHVAEAGLPLLSDKIRASSDVFHHLIGTIGTPQKFEERREILAQAVWDKMKSNDSRECRSCHSFATMDLLSQRPGARKYHAIAQKEGATCIDCHKGIAHFLPITSDKSSGASKLLDAAKAVPASATKLFAVQTTPLYLTADTKDENQGRVMPSAPVERIGQEGERLKVRITGWRQEGVDKILYFAPGKRIMSASLSDDTARKVTAGQAETDASTNQKWTAASLEAFVEKDKFVDKTDPLWDYAKQMMTTNCGTCHGEPDMHHFTANQWIGVIQSMQTRTSMDPEQVRMLTQYSQKHGSDMDGQK